MLVKRNLVILHLICSQPCAFICLTSCLTTFWKIWFQLKTMIYKFHKSSLKITEWLTFQPLVTSKNGQITYLLHLINISASLVLEARTFTAFPICDQQKYQVSDVLNFYIIRQPLPQKSELSLQYSTDVIHLAKFTLASTFVSYQN